MRDITPPIDRLLDDRLNLDIGTEYWRYFVACSFWSTVSTPVNMMITILSALVSSQANTGGALLSAQANARLSLALLVLSAANTFARPHAQLQESHRLMARWNALGIELESTVFDATLSAREKEQRLTALAANVIALKRGAPAAPPRNLTASAGGSSSSASTVTGFAFLTEAIFGIARLVCWRGKLNRLVYITPERQRVLTTDSLRGNNEVSQLDMQYVFPQSDIETHRNTTNPMRSQ